MSSQHKKVKDFKSKTVPLPSWISEMDGELMTSQEPGFIALLEDLRNKDKAQKITGKATDAFYSDFGSPLATPMIALVQALQSINAGDLVEKATKGVYDHNWVYYNSDAHDYS
jgi:hypothetical protein